MNEQHTGEGGTMNENEGTEIAHRTAEAWLAENELIPLALVALQADESIELVADRLRDVVRFDDVGMRVIPSVAAREFFFERAEQEARVANQARRLEETHEPSPIPVGVPALEDASPFASLMAADSSYASPSEEFGGRPKPRFVQEAIEQGERQLPLLKRRLRPRRRLGTDDDDHLGSSPGTGAAIRHQGQGPTGAERE